MSQSSRESETPSDLKTVLGWLKDPVTVHLNMLRGAIAKPTWEQIQHLYPEQFASLAQRPSTPFTEEMLLAGARAIFNAEIGAPDWHFPYWRDFKADCFRYARLVLEATSDTSTTREGK